MNKVKPSYQLADKLSASMSRLASMAHSEKDSNRKDELLQAMVEVGELGEVFKASTATDYFSEFVKDAVRTEANADAILISITPGQLRLLHAVIGMLTELGELGDTVKRHVFYGQPLDVPNLKEEIGDLTWYEAILCDETDISMTAACVEVINKLRKRYPKAFTNDCASERKDKQLTPRLANANDSEL